MPSPLASSAFIFAALAIAAGCSLAVWLPFAAGGLIFQLLVSTAAGYVPSVPAQPKVEQLPDIEDHRFE